MILAKSLPYGKASLSNVTYKSTLSMAARQEQMESQLLLAKFCQRVSSLC